MTNDAREENEKEAGTVENEIVKKYNAAQDDIFLLFYAIIEKFRQLEEDVKQTQERLIKHENTVKYLIKENDKEIEEIRIFMQRLNSAISKIISKLED